MEYNTVGGTLAKARSSATLKAAVKVYTVPADADFATITIRCTNIGPATGYVNVWIGDNPDAPTDLDYLEFETSLSKGGHVENTCVVVSPGDTIYISSDLSTIITRVYGLLRKTVE